MNPNALERHFAWVLLPVAAKPSIAMINLFIAQK
jgi:hypothetical protein